MESVSFVATHWLSDWEPTWLINFRLVGNNDNKWILPINIIIPRRYFVVREAIILFESESHNRMKQKGNHV